MVAQKVVGTVIIVAAFALLYIISALAPPTFVQIGVAFIGSFICLVGIVVVFSEQQIDIKAVLGKHSPKVEHPIDIKEVPGKRSPQAQLTTD